MPGPSLILGGTPEAAALARAAVAAGLDVIVSLAGATRAPAALAGRARVGGFGGPSGLAAWLRAEGIARMVDATHPFAARMHANAVEAAAAAGLPLLRLIRPPWARQPGDRWMEARDASEAADRASSAVSGKGRDPRTMRIGAAGASSQPGPLPQAGGGEGVVFLAVGRKELPAFASVKARFLVRLIEPASLPLADAELILARGPFGLAEERELFRTKDVRLVVAKNSGGEGAYAKVAAARELGIPVVMIARAPLPPADETASVQAALAWLRRGGRPAGR